MQSRPRVVIVGGGVSGLATAHYIHGRLGAQVRLTVVDSGSKLGGKVSTEPFGGHLVDTGPDALLVRIPAMAALLEDLGLGDQIVAPSALGAHIWSRGRLRRIPTGTMFGVPDRLIPLLKSRLLSPLGIARAGLDLVLPRRRPVGHLADDPSIADLVAPRLGPQVFDRLVEPLLGGVHAGRAAELSARSTVPEIAALAGKNRSLYLGLLRLRLHAPPKSGGPVSPVLITLAGGLGRLVDAMVARLGDTDLLLDSTVHQVSRDGDGYRVDLADGQSIPADAVVMATPAFASARILADLAPDVATILAEVPYVDVATIWFSYPRSAMGRPLDGTGFLVPPEEGKFLVGCTWSSAKWPHLADKGTDGSGGSDGSDGTVLIRCMVGRRGDTRWLTMDDETLVRRCHEELVEAMGLTEGPVDQSIQRWPQAMPQYLVGHAGRLGTLKAQLSHLPGLYLTGAAYRGVGIASCVADAERIARDVVHDVSGPPADVRPLTEVTS